MRLYMMATSSAKIGARHESIAVKIAVQLEGDEPGVWPGVK
jgi:hypothetical protein